jgi:sec-independent protein translocase protein TatA
MGLGGISFGSLLLIFLIILLLFGTKRLRDMGEDLGQAVRNFRKGLQGDEGNPDKQNGVTKKEP